MLSINELKALSVKVANEEDGFDFTGYGKAVGIGSGAGTMAGIPIGLLAHALLADEKNRGLRDYLKSGLIGGLVGTGVGGAAGGGLRAYLASNPEASDSVAQLLGGMKSTDEGMMGQGGNMLADALTDAFVAKKK